MLEPKGDNTLFETGLEILKDREFTKKKQRGSIVTGRRAGIFSMPNVPSALGTASLEINNKTLRFEETDMLSERLEPANEATKEVSENIGVQSMYMEVPSIDSLTPLEAAAISCVLKECLERLATVEFMIPVKVDPRWDDTFKTIDETYGIPDEPRKIFREDMGLLPLIPTKSQKLQRDRNYMYKVLERVLHDVRDNRRFDSLQEEINNIAKRHEEERHLEANAEVWSNQAKQLQELIAYDKKRNEIDRKQKIKLAQESDAQVDHTIFSNNGKLDYVERWEKAKMEQQELKLQLEKTDLLNKLKYYLEEYDAESYISTEVNAYLEADIKEKEEQIIMWTNRYNEEVAQLQYKIDDLKTQIEEQKLELEDMTILSDKNQESIDKHIAEQKRLQEETEELNRLNQAAIIIQSMWKGYMVRHKLGKYKKLRKRLKRGKMKQRAIRKKSKKRT